MLRECVMSRPTPIQQASRRSGSIRFHVLYALVIIIGGWTAYAVVPITALLRLRWLTVIVIVIALGLTLVSHFYITIVGPTMNSPWVPVIASLALVNGFIWGFSNLYMLIGSSPKSHCMDVPPTKIDSFYFTVTVFSTTGFGDIKPISQPCRLLTGGQMLCGFILITYILALIVAQVSSMINRANAK